MTSRSATPIIVVLALVLAPSAVADSGSRELAARASARCLYDVYDGIYESVFLRYDLDLAFHPWLQFTSGGEIDMSRESLKSVQIGYRTSLHRIADIDLSYVRRWFRPYGVLEDHAVLTVESSLPIRGRVAAHRAGFVTGVNGTRARATRTEASNEPYIELSAFPLWQIYLQSRISTFLGRIDFGNYDRMQLQSRNYWQIRIAATWNPAPRFVLSAEAGAASAGPLPGAGDLNRRWFGMGGSYALR